MRTKHTYQIVGTIPSGNSVHGIAIAREFGRAFIGSRGGVMTVVDGNTGRIVTTQAIGKGVDATEFDIGRKLVYFSCGDGTMWVFHQDAPDKYSLAERVTTQTGPRMMAVDYKGGRAFLSVAEFGPRPATALGAPAKRAPDGERIPGRRPFRNPGIQPAVGRDRPVG